MNKLLRLWPWMCAIAILALPIFPFQDLPMHLTYAHLLANWEEASAYYVKAPEYNVYFNTHLLLAFLSKMVGNVENAFRLCMAFYFVLFYWCLRQLERAFGLRGIALEWRAHFLLLALNGTMLLGFVSYAFGIPLVLLGFALMIFWQDEKYPLKSNYLYALLGLVFLLGMMHPVLPWAFFVAAVIYHYPQYPKLKLLPLFAVPMAVLWMLGVPGKSNLLKIPNGFLHNGYGFEFIDSLFRTNWSGVPTKMNYFLWQWALPVRIIPLLMSIFVILGLLFFVYRYARSKDYRSPTIMLRSFLLMFFGLMLPWGIYWPSEITFINFRLVSTWGMVPFLLFGHYWCQSELGKKLWRVLGIAQSLGVIIAVWLAAADFKAPFTLIEKLPPNMRLLPLIFDGKSPSLAKIYDTTHFAAMYYVVRNHGRSHQFWGRYTSHLPVDWQERERMPGPADWRPWEFQEKHLSKADYVLLTFPYERQRADMMAQSILEKSSVSTQCVQNWCLYQIRQ